MHGCNQSFGRFRCSLIEWVFAVGGVCTACCKLWRLGGARNKKQDLLNYYEKFCVFVCVHVCACAYMSVTRQPISSSCWSMVTPA